ncbi:VOC family protein [Sphingomonas mollis]|uniref:VOC family protein n=1 Tax=Sphingomonas mollis TaxID=2795726 RepID=A0ABS0XMF7_9SPHN|nr:VOC family protein [Sphingomonas sp. BT553]MBJ6121210.1 VOC family protein [Sphingomonas sp. BT553]
MTSPIIPSGFAAVTPYVFVTGAPAYIEFLIRAFDAVEVGRSVDPAGRIANAQLRLSGSMLMLSEASAAFPPARSAFYLYVDDADRALVHAVDAGATAIMAVADMDYGDRQGGVRDPAGNIWWLSQRLSDRAYH